MSRYEVTIEVTVEVELNGEQAEYSVQRYVDNEDGIQEYLYGPMSYDQVLAHLAYNGSCNGVHDASRLDGWADIEPGSVTMSVVNCDRDPSYVFKIKE